MTTGRFEWRFEPRVEIFRIGRRRHVFQYFSKTKMVTVLFWDDDKILM